MDDIDRTFERLKRLDFKTLVTLMPFGPSINPVTFDAEYNKWAEPTCLANGWTLNEVNEELKKI